jgi:hypothetical protein
MSATFSHGGCQVERDERLVLSQEYLDLMEQWSLLSEGSAPLHTDLQNWTLRQ